MKKLYIYKILLIISLISTSTRGQTKTITINSSKEQGAIFDCFFNPCKYQWTQGNEIIFGSNITKPKTTNARYLFDHSGFKNKDIKKITLELKIKKIKEAPLTDYVYMKIKMPLNTCNNSVPWGILNSETEIKKLYECNMNGNSIFNQGIGTNSNFDKTLNLLIYDDNSTGFTKETIKHFDPESESFTFSFHPFSGGIEISTAKVHITYESNCIIPDSVVLNANPESPYSISLSWPNANNATNYEIYDCKNDQLIAFRSSTNYIVNNLLPNTEYRYKIRSINSCGKSAFSDCVSITTPTLNGGHCSSLIKNEKPKLQIYQYASEHIRITWKPMDKADSYMVFRCETGEKVGETISTEFFFPRESLKPGETYSFRIIGVDHCANGQQYNSKMSTCSISTNIPCKASKIQSWNINHTSTPNSITLEWRRVWPYGNYKYEIFDCDTGKKYYNYYNNKHTIRALPNTSYGFKIRSVGCEPSEFSDCIYITTPNTFSNSKKIDFSQSKNKTSTTKTTKDHIITYSNPVKDILFIKIKEEFLGGGISLYDITKKLLWRKKRVQSEEIVNMSTLKPGLYLLKYNIGNKSIIKKVIKK